MLFIKWWYLSRITLNSQAKDKNMRFSGFLLVLLVLTAVLPQIAHASPGAKPWIWSWWPNHWRGLDFQPYLKDEKLSQRSLWDDDQWTPEAWIKDAGDARRIMRDLYAANIITDQYRDGDNIPVLEVGYGYKKLSMLDRNRIAQFVDHVFEITSSEENGMFFIKVQGNKHPIGVYNKYGLQHY